jgi:hypothetical protein
VPKKNWHPEKSHKRSGGHRVRAIRLQHFHFCCLQSDGTQRGFTSRKAALRRLVLFRVEVKML